MEGVNKIILMGNVVSEPKMSELPNEDKTKKVELSLAVNRPGAKKLKEAGKQDVDFFTCEAFAGAAETIGTYLKRGDPFYIEGNMHFDRVEKETEEGLKATYYPKVVITEFRFISNKKD